MTEDHLGKAPQWDVTAADEDRVVRVHAFTSRHAVSRVTQHPEDTLFLNDTVDSDGKGLIAVFNTPAGIYLVNPVAAQPAEEPVAVIIAVHNGATDASGRMMFANKYYALPVEVVAEIQDIAAPYEIPA